MEQIETLLKTLGLVKTSPDWIDKLRKIYEKDIFCSSPFSAGSRFVTIKVTIHDDRESILISTRESGFFEDLILYEGYCKTPEYLILILQNIFGGDGDTQEHINEQFNDRLY